MEVLVGILEVSVREAFKKKKKKSVKFFTVGGGSKIKKFHGF